jgi:RimJ/RimL family protein N-acetyltransferase
MEPVRLATDRLVLRPLEGADISVVHAACQDPDIPRWTSVPSPYTREHAEAFVREFCPNGWQNDTMYNFGVFTRGDGQFVGSMGLVRLALLYTEERQAELGYWTAKEQRGRGYTVEAARAVCDWAFAVLGVERMEWYAEAGNFASRAVPCRPRRHPPRRMERLPAPVRLGAPDGHPLPAAPRGVNGTGRCQWPALR